MKEQLHKAWQLNNEKNLLLLHHLGEPQLTVTSSPKGQTVGRQIAHLHSNRVTWIGFVAKALYKAEEKQSKETDLTIPILTEALSTSAQKIAQVIDESWEKGGKLPSFKTGLIPFISYLISHESHHRGNILLTLKQNGFALPNSLKCGLWEWTK